MKITHITAQNYLGARAVDLPVTAPVLLVAGKNGAGKSSVQEAVRHALAGGAALDIGRNDMEFANPFDCAVQGGNAGGVDAVVVTNQYSHENRP